MQNNQKGFSLIEILIVSAILGIVTITIGNVFMNQLQAANYVEDKLSKNSLKMDIQNLISDSTACTLSLVNTSIPAIGGAAIAVTLKDRTGLVMYDSSSTTKNTYEKITIISMMLSNLDITKPESQGTLQLSVTTQRQRTGGGPPVFAPLIFNLQATIDPDNKVLSCGTVTNSLGGLFQEYFCDKTCRRPNPITGTCSCPNGYAAHAFDEFDAPAGAPCGAQAYYEGKGMILFQCIKK